MRTFTKEELKLILKKHLMWLNREPDGERANLSSADLRAADLRAADLRFANLSFADLSFADLRSADLRHADLSFADLRAADLRSAHLLVFQFNRHQALFTFDGMIKIGCHYLELKKWLKEFKVIGKKEGYTKEEIDAYGTFIKLCAKLQKTHKKGKSK